MEPKDKQFSHRFSDLPVDLWISVGRARCSLGELMEMDSETVIYLDSQIDDPVDIMIGERVVARGILQENDGNGRRQLSVKLTEVKHPDSDV